jgi:hypothetical protein
MHLQMMTPQEWLTEAWSNEDVREAKKYMRGLIQGQQELKNASGMKVLHHGTLVPLQVFLYSSAPMIMADVNNK